MERIRAAEAFATLGHPGRLAVFRLLMRFAPQGVRPTEMASALGLKQNTLSHHLADLTACGLVGVTRQGRSLHYAVDLEATEALIGYLALDVGRGRPDLLGTLLSRRPDIVPTARPRRDTGFDVLFICSGNSARSIISEALLRDLGKGVFRAFSAGTQPGAAPHPLVLDVLRQHGHDTSGLRSKPLSAFRQPGADVMDVVITVCDTAAAEDCPPWPGQPIAGHWGVPDPAAATGTEAEKALAFARTYATLRRRITALVARPVERLSRLSLQSRVDAIGADTQAKA